MTRSATDAGEAVELAPRIWWVGSLIPDDQFQCHVYLVEQGDQSVLIDPGSALISDEIIRKVDSVVGLHNVRWLVCSHEDPDIIGALPAMVAQGLHPEAMIVTHWRDEALIKHSGTPLPFWRIDEHEWRLELEDRSLQFIPIPYLHFAGAFCTFDKITGTLFSGDLFGGFTRDQSLFATSMAYFDSIRAFHEHYMPSREILAHSLERLRELPLQRIAPQHGQVIPRELIDPIIDRLGKLECGVYLLAREDPGLAFLLAANEAIHDVVDTLVREPRFSDVIAHLAELAKQMLGARSLELWAQVGVEFQVFDSSDGFAGHPARPPSYVRSTFDGAPHDRDDILTLPLVSIRSNLTEGVAVVSFAHRVTFDTPTRSVVEQIVGLVEVGFERELLRRSAELEKREWHDRAIHDPLTGLLNRESFDEWVSRLFSLDDRSERPAVAALMIDIDHFKFVNDTYGHSTGDTVLQRVASAISKNVRPSDVSFRFGGEEFLVLLSGVDGEAALRAAERIRSGIAEPLGAPPAVTASAGIAVRQAGETPAALVERADAALYRAKAEGRDRSVVA